ncbi:MULTISPECIES: flagellar type III secretion system pore protein FliP [unclassified Fusibacter]|uniref:flagellar type III secretion system pore protein FliP n=1 Tax=unclassified Fusibacter TaxID=2624464 RepID=UPI0010131D18|nr:MULTISPECIES: flagellar type III secretion system pore protein FliP [unclassified Fusibacter]MCK8058772.1 flagellar type III secretion system pore protein FliP [Fusibacter sp. A2]NPE21846.1 flagellar type III secretion system pore protein FliP [Fusibacter sp. A1]RXV61418.1 flagellar biosynthetic protein FliP [Fusibacter sp. A1]
MKRQLISFALLALILIAFGAVFADAPFQIPNIELKVGDDTTGLTSTVQVIILLTVLTLAPSIIIMTTCFTRIIIIFSFMRKALALQSTPPNQILIGLSLFLTLFIMGPVFTTIYDDAYIPMAEGTISQDEAYEKAINPLRDFMFKQVRTEDLALFVKISGEGPVTTLDEVSTTALIPAFVISEMKTGFIVGFLLFIPFIVIDMVVASTLMALGMMMLPPVMISLPFKILLFILVDGWNLLIKAIIQGFNV